MIDTNFSNTTPAAVGEASDMAAVAIVGMALRVPGALTLGQFWQNLRDGVESTTFFDDGQLRAAGVPEADLRDPSYVKALGVLEGADLFDAGFFDLPPREAETLDPQHRQLLECGWEALEHAGYAPGCGSIKAAGCIGVMAGVGLNSYLLHNLMGRTDLIETLGGWQLNLGNDKDFAATRVAYKLDLRGAALNVSTACSTSLVAVAFACQSLLSYQCDMILVGGCSIHLPQDQGYWHHPGGTLSPDGHCRAFDIKAQGTVDGNGVAMVVLKRLDDALHDGDTIHAVIRGFAVNNDGALKVGYTAPSVEGQSAVIREAQEMAEVGADTIAYVETHGTGTDLGDLVEITALTEAFRGAGVSATQQCGLGSVKTNVGHLDTAAGATSLIKTALGLSHGQIPPSLHFTHPNPKLELETSPFYVNAALRAWPQLKGAPRRAGVSSFGIGGTNAHVVVEEAPAVPASDPGMAWQLLPISARSPDALQQNASRLAAHLRTEAGAPLADVAYTLQLGRRAFAQRQVILADNRVDAIAALSGSRGDRVFSGNAAEHAQSAVFLFPGQDAQYAGMAQTLYRDAPLFRKEVDLCAESVRRTHGIDLLARLFPSAGAADPAFATDPLPLFVVEYALARVWIALGVQPRAMLGYSLGEYVCACLAGVVELDDALSLAIAGGRLLSLLSPGPLLAVSLPENELRPLLSVGLGIAMVSAPRQCVVGGRPDAVAALKQALTKAGASYVAIPLGLPFHTEFMEPFLTPYRAELRKVRFSPPKIPYVSCVTGDWIRPEEATDPEHYLRLAGQTVQLARGLEQLFAVPDAIFLEIGPGQVMAGFVMLQNGRPDNLDVLSTLRDPRYAAMGATASDLPALLTTVAKVWTAGVDIDWSALHRNERRRRVPLPTYAFEHRRYWVEAQPAQKSPTPEPAGKLADTDKWCYLPVWRELPPPGKTEVAGRWLVVGAHAGLAQPLAGLVAAAGGEAVYHDFAGLSCADAAGWDTLFNSAEQGGKPFDHIVYLGLLGHRGTDDELLDAGLHAVIALGLALGRRVFSESATLTVIADGLFPAGDAVLSPAKAAVLGPLHVLPQEYPNLHCQVIDVVAPELPWQQARLLEETLHELAGNERAVALRPGRRYVEEFAPYRLPVAAAQTFKAGGVYLITGGLGNIGMALAGHIAQQAPGAHLVLTSRQPLHTLAGARLQQVQALQALGAKVRVAAADVTDERAMAALVQDMERSLGALNGVIHAAGLVGKESFATVNDSSRAFCATQLNPKLKGARVLEQVLGERALDFCLLCSSLSPILGGLGFTAYAAANACLDALAVDHNRRHPTRWISVNWEGWRFDDEEPELNQAGAAVAELGLLPAEGCAAFARILAAPPVDRIVLSTGDLGRRIRQWVELEAPPPDAVSAPHHARPAMLGGYVAPSAPMETEVARLWERLLGIDGIGIHDSFFELGGNSLLLTQLLAQIRKAFRLELSLASLFERPTIAGIAVLLVEASQAAQVMDGEEREEGVL
ncbi:MAG: SDR family NAD(P)-dependent oxidoreductase [Sulfuricellaceae bacterium]